VLGQQFSSILIIQYFPQIQIILKYFSVVWQFLLRSQELCNSAINAFLANFEFIDLFLLDVTCFSAVLRVWGGGFAVRWNGYCSASGCNIHDSAYLLLLLVCVGGCRGRRGPPEPRIGLCITAGHTTFTATSACALRNS
jgi:hypothetical protein